MDLDFIELFTSMGRYYLLFNHSKAESGYSLLKAVETWLCQDLIIRMNVGWCESL